MTLRSARVYRMLFAAAAAYNIAFGLWASLVPQQFFRLFAMPAARYPAIFACLGMVVGLYGVGYAYAAWRLDRAHPFIAIGLAGKVLGPIGWLVAVHDGELPFRTFPLIAFDDLLWWAPFALFLLEGSAIANFLKQNIACIAGIFHAIAAIGTLLFLRSMELTSQDVGSWRAGWLVWMITAVTLVGFYARWSGSRFPIAIAAMGLGCDFAGESILIGWLPHAGSSLSRAASLLTGGAANGLYTLAGMLVTIRSTAPVLLRAWAWVAWVSGIALTVFTIADRPRGVLVASAALIAAFTPWLFAMGRQMR